jgi:hypothetical protein
MLMTITWDGKRRSNSQRKRLKHVEFVEESIEPAPAVEVEDEERPATPPEGEQEFTDDDGTVYKWDRGLNSWVPQVSWKHSCIPLSVTSSLLVRVLRRSFKIGYAVAGILEEQSLISSKIDDLKLPCAPPVSLATWSWIACICVSTEESPGAGSLVWHWGR